jgi:hypothetical protein
MEDVELYIAHLSVKQLAGRSSVWSLLLPMLALFIMPVVTFFMVSAIGGRGGSAIPASIGLFGGAVLWLFFHILECQRQLSIVLCRIISSSDEQI